MKKWICCCLIIVSGCQSFGSLEQERKPSEPPAQVEGTRGTCSRRKILESN